MRSGIYQITCLSNNKTYFGSAKNIQHRWDRHKTLLQSNRHHCESLQSSYNKYGCNDLVYSILLYCASKDLLFYEQRCLNVYWDNGKTCFNVCKIAGSRLGSKDSAETKLKKSLSRIGIKDSEETKKRKSIAVKGRSKSQEHKDKLSKALVGKVVSEETKQKMALAKLGKSLGPRSEETKRKISLAKTTKK